MALETFNFDPSHSQVAFSARHLMISKVSGLFKVWSGTLIIDEADYTASRVTAEIDAASIDSKEEQRDTHLRSADFLDTAQYPAITFASTSVEKLSDDHFKVAGSLSIHGVTKPVVLDTDFFGRQKDPWGDERAGFSARPQSTARSSASASTFPWKAAVGWWEIKSRSRSMSKP